MMRPPDGQQRRGGPGENGGVPRPLAPSGDGPKMVSYNSHTKDTYVEQENIDFLITSNLTQ